VTAACIIDLYPGDKQVDWKVYCAAGPPWHGAIFKASQALRYSYLEWLTHQRSLFIAAAGDRYGLDLFDGMYHYLDLGQDGTKQADFFMHNVEASGGEQKGTLPAMVDVERGGQLPTDCTLARVEHVTRGFAERYKALTGREATLYGGELLRSVGVKDRLGCSRSAVALYGPKLQGRGIDTNTTEKFLHATGTDLAHTLLWQYGMADDPSEPPAGYPSSAQVPGAPTRVDVSAVLQSDGVSALRALLS